MAQESTHLLSGVTIVEVAGRVSGAYCGWLLAGLGASVTRVALPLAAHAGHAEQRHLKRALRRGKETLGPDDPALLALVASCDVVVTDALHDDAHDGAVTAVARRLLAARPQGLPVVELTDFGPADGGPERPGSPLVVGAATAASWSIGDPEREPLSLPYDAPDYFAGAEAAAATVAALMLPPDPAGSVTRVASADVLGYYVGMVASNFIPYARRWHRDGPRAYKSGGSYPAAIFPCSDGAVAIMCRQPREWRSLRAAMGDPPWSRDDAMQDGRVVAMHHAAEADRHLTAWTRSHRVAELVAMGGEYGFPIAPVREVHESFADPQFADRGYFRPLNDGDEPLLVPGPPYRVAARCQGQVPRTRDVADGDGPLAGIRVLDFSWVWSGPMVTSALAALGADVIKVESGARPDPVRMRGAGVRDGRPYEGPALELSPYFNQINHGKRSIAIDITTPAGRELALRLAEASDVTVENMRPGALERRGLGYADLSGRNPSLVMLSMSVSGQTGPARGLGGYAPVMTGLAGLEALVRYEDSAPMGVFNLAIGDPNAASHALAVVLAAIHRQRLTGEGSWIDLSQIECVSSLLVGPALEAQLHGAARPPANGHACFAPHGHFRAAGEDAWVAVAVRSAGERERLRSLLGANGDLDGALRAWVAGQPAEAAERALAGIGIPASVVRSFEQLGTLVPRASAIIEHPFIGEQRVVGLPWGPNDRPRPPRRAAPLLGEHTESVLADVLGIDAVELEELRAQGAIAPVESPPGLQQPPLSAT